MTGKTGGELNLADWQSDKRAAKLNSTKFLSNISNQSPSAWAEDVSQLMSLINLKVSVDWCQVD